MSWEGHREARLMEHLCCPPWPETQARALTGVEPATSWFAGWYSIHWATPTRAMYPCTLLQCPPATCGSINLNVSKLKLNKKFSALGHGLLRTWNVANVTEWLNFKFYLILINLHLNSDNHTWWVATTSASTAFGLVFWCHLFIHPAKTYHDTDF